MDHRIPLDPSVYKLHSQRSHGGSDECAHDWTQQENGQWVCERCGRVVEFERWND